MDAAAARPGFSAGPELILTKYSNKTGQHHIMRNGDSQLLKLGRAGSNLSPSTILLCSLERTISPSGAHTTSVNADGSALESCKSQQGL